MSDNGYIGDNGQWWPINSRHVGVNGIWEPQQYKYIGKNGFWKLVYTNGVIDTSGQFYINSLQGYTVNAYNQLEIYGSRFSDSQYPYPKIGLFMPLEQSFSDVFENYISGSGVGGPIFSTVSEERALQIITDGQYAIPSINPDSGLPAHGLSGSLGDKSYGVSIWAYLPSAEMPLNGERRYLWFAGNPEKHITVFINSAGKVCWEIQDSINTTSIISNNNFISDEWNKIVINRDGSAPINSKLYLNGVLQGNLSININVSIPSGLPILIGAGKEYDTTTPIPPKWNSNRIHPDYLISNNSRNVSKNRTLEGYETARGMPVITKNTGKYYFELVWSSTNYSTVIFLGLSEPTFDTSSAIGISSWCINSIGRTFNHQTGGGTTWGVDTSFAVNDVLGFAYDSNAGSLIVYKNGILLGTPFGAGIINQDVEVCICIDLASEIVANFEASHWQYSAPSGYNQIPSGISYSGEKIVSSTGGYFKNFYAAQVYLNQDNIRRLTEKPSPQIILKNIATNVEYPIATTFIGRISNDKISFTIPPELPEGQYNLFAKSLDFQTRDFPLMVEPFIKRTTPLIEDFSSTEAFENNWLALHKAWGGANGGVVSENVFIRDGELILKANGDNYTGNVQGVDNNGKLKFHTNPSDPKLGQPWVTRVGACLVSRENLGFGSYRVLSTIPPLTGVAAAFWTFHYEEIYPGDARYQAFQDEGLHEQGSAENGYYITRNHEIDIELPSNLDGQPSNQVSWQNAKFNSWRGELQNWDVDPSDPAYWEEYNAKLTNHNINVSDGGFHEFRFDWHSDRVEFFIDGILKQTQTNTIKGDILPDIPGKFTLGLWFPSSPKALEPWNYDPLRAWAGASAAWEAQEMRVKKIEFFPFNEIGERFIGETYPFGGSRNLHNDTLTPPPPTDPDPIVIPLVQFNVNTSGKPVSGTIRIYDELDTLVDTQFFEEFALTNKPIKQPAVWRMEIDVTNTGTVAMVMEIYVEGIYLDTFNVPSGQTREGLKNPYPSGTHNLIGEIGLAIY